MDKAIDFLIKNIKKIKDDYRTLKNQEFPFGYIAKAVTPWKLRQDLEFPLNVFEFMLKHFEEMRAFLSENVPPKILTELSRMSKIYIDMISEDTSFEEFQRYEKEDFTLAESAFLKAKKMRSEEKQKVRPNGVYHKLFYDIASDPKYLAKHLLENLSVSFENVLPAKLKQQFLDDLKERDSDLYYKYINRFERENIKNEDKFELAIKNMEEEIGKDLIYRIRKGLKSYYGDEEKRRPLANLRRAYKMIFNELAEEDLAPSVIVIQIIHKLMQDPVVTAFKLAPFFSKELLGNYKDLFPTYFNRMISDIKKIDQFIYNENGIAEIPMTSLTRFIGLGLLDKETVKKILLELVKRNDYKQVIAQAKKAGLENLMYEIEGFVGSYIEEFDTSKRRIEDEKSFDQLINRINSEKSNEKIYVLIRNYINGLFEMYLNRSMVDLVKKLREGYDKISSQNAKNLYVRFLGKYGKLVSEDLNKYVQDVLHRMKELDTNDIKFLKYIINLNNVKVDSPSIAAFLYILSQKDPTINKKAIHDFFIQIFNNNKDAQDIYSKIKEFWDLISSSGLNLPDSDSFNILLEGLINKNFAKIPNAYDFIRILKIVGG